MGSGVGFWSYSRADDLADQGRILDLAKDLQEEFAMQTAESIDIFVDRTSLQWGDDWKDTIDSSIESTLFFIAILSPRYFASSLCRRELEYFLEKSTLLGISELVLPILYVDVPEIHNEGPSDQLLAQVIKFNWHNWTELRFADRSSSAYRKAVAAMATRLIRANASVELSRIKEAKLDDADRPEDEDPPGQMDLMADAEAKMPDLTSTLQSLGFEIGEIAPIMSAAKVRMDKRDSEGKGFAGRLAVLREVALELEPIANRILELASRFGLQMQVIDAGLRPMIGLARDDSEKGDAAEKAEFLRNISDLGSAADKSLSSLDGLIGSIIPLEKQSRDLRPVLRTLRRGLTAVRGAKETTDTWLELSSTRDQEEA